MKNYYILNVNLIILFHHDPNDEIIYNNDANT